MLIHIHTLQPFVNNCNILYKKKTVTRDVLCGAHSPFIMNRPLLNTSKTLYSLAHTSITRRDAIDGIEKV